MTLQKVADGAVFFGDERFLMWQVIIIGLGTFGAVRLRHVALAESMIAAMSEDDEP